jgi:hypothetical protein
MVYKLLRFSGAQTENAAVAQWFEAKNPALGDIARAWFAKMRKCGADVRELVHDGCPVACVDDAPFGYVNVFTAHAAVGFFHGASLPDPANILTGAGKYMRHVKIKPDGAVDRTALEELIMAAYRDIGVRLKHEERTESHDAGSLRG